MTAIDNAKPGPAHSSAGQTVCQFVAPATARQAAAARHAQGQPDADLLWAGRLGCGGSATAPPAPRWPATTASRATARRYRGEVIIVLAEQTPQLSDALERTTNEGLSHVILDGKIIPVNPGSNKSGQHPGDLRSPRIAGTERPDRVQAGWRCPPARIGAYRGGYFCWPASVVIAEGDRVSGARSRRVPRSPHAPRGQRPGCPGPGLFRRVRPWGLWWGGGRDQWLT